MSDRRFTKHGPAMFAYFSGADDILIHLLSLRQFHKGFYLQGSFFYFPYPYAL